MSDPPSQPEAPAEPIATLPVSVTCMRCLTKLGGVRLDGVCPKCGLPAAVSAPASVRIMMKQGLRRAPQGLLCQRCGHSLAGLTLKEFCPECELGVDTSIEGGGWQPALTDDGAVLADTPCARCGYLRASLRQSMRSQQSLRLSRESLTSAAPCVRSSFIRAWLPLWHTRPIWRPRTDARKITPDRLENDHSR